ncbi:MAG: hypothetical protein ACRDQB_17185 [Thermocrispum sp.]
MALYLFCSGMPRILCHRQVQGYTKVSGVIKRPRAAAVMLVP